MTDFALARHNMVESQIRTNKVTDTGVIDAFAEIPREKFAPAAMKSVAYVDEDLSIGDDRYLMEPMVLARLLQIALPQPDDVVLDIGGGSGYSAAILSKLVSTVVAVESDDALAAIGNSAFSDLEIDNAAMVSGNMEEGYAKQAPYDLILFGGSVEQVPEIVMSQLAASGRIVGVFNDENGVGRASIMTKNGDNISTTVIFDASVPSLPGFRRAAGFVF